MTELCSKNTESNCWCTNCCPELYAKNKGIKASMSHGMIDISNDEVSYGNIRNLYKKGDGHGLQLSERLEHKRGEIFDILAAISDKFYELEDVLKR